MEPGASALSDNGAVGSLVSFGIPAPWIKKNQTEEVSIGKLCSRNSG